MAKDIYHNHVREALESDGWNITHDPYYIRIGEVDFFIDLGAEGVIGAEREGQKIAVEVKSFGSLSKVADFHEAYGKYGVYRKALRQDQERVLYLAISEQIYRDFFQKPFIQMVIEEDDVKLLIFDTESKKVVSWKD
ncbi:MAG: XisH family protein [Saprospiraceae bacterium]|nr:XisH family protein [Saprospiraceae bacterium]